MLTRSTTSTLTFRHSFVMPGYTDRLPPGDYDVLVEEELIEGLSFQAYRRTATYLTLRGTGAAAGQTELRPTTGGDLDNLILRDRQDPPPGTASGEAAL